jgi:hypothetical protein
MPEFASKSATKFPEMISVAELRCKAELDRAIFTMLNGLLT